MAKKHNDKKDIWNDQFKVYFVHNKMHQNSQYIHNFAVRSTVSNMFLSTLASNARNGVLKRGDNEAYTSVY